MISRTHRQIDLIVRHEVKQRRAALKLRLEALYADHAAKGRLQSGATIKVAISTMREVARQTLSGLHRRIVDIAADPSAFQALSLAMEDLLAFFRTDVDQAVLMASGRQPSDPNSSIESAAFALFNELDSEIEAELEILSFDYLGIPAQEPANVEEVKPRFQLKSRGRPPAEFWDEMWAAIATKLYCGDLDPKAQGDVESVMTEWIEGHGFDVAVSTVRKRARLSWDAIDASA